MNPNSDRRTVNAVIGALARVVPRIGEHTVLTTVVGYKDILARQRHQIVGSGVGEVYRRDAEDRSRQNPKPVKLDKPPVRYPAAYQLLVVG